MDIMKVEKVFGTSTSPVLLETDAGKGVLKLPSQCWNLDQVLCEYVGSGLARVIGVPTPDFALIHTDQDFVDLMEVLKFPCQSDEDGFISRFETVFSYDKYSAVHIRN